MNGEDLRRHPLIERKQRLRQLIRTARKSRVLYADHIEGRGVDLFHAVCKQNLEGIIAKRKDSVYSSAGYWLKIKNPNYTQAEGRRELFESMRPGPKKAKHRAALDEKKGA